MKKKIELEVEAEKQFKRAGELEVKLAEVGFQSEAGATIKQQLAEIETRRIALGILIWALE